MPPPATQLSATLPCDEEPVVHSLPHLVTVYVVEPFNCGTHFKAAVRYTRAVMQAVHRCYLGVLRALPPRYQPYVQFETVSSI